jgi:hypothetical protein
MGRTEIPVCLTRTQPAAHFSMPMRRCRQEDRFGLVINDKYAA